MEDCGFTVRGLSQVKSNTFNTALKNTHGHGHVNMFKNGNEVQFIHNIPVRTVHLTSFKIPLPLRRVLVIV